MTSQLSQVSSTVGKVRENELRTVEMKKSIKQKDYDRVSSTAQAIYQDGIDIVRGEVCGQSIVAEELTDVMISLADLSNSHHIQHKLHVLIPVLKALRVMTEITWYQCSRNGKQRIYTEDRDNIINLTNRLKEVFPKYAKMEKGVLLSSAGARYELACIKQAAKCLSPSDSLWKSVIGPIAEAIFAAATKDLGGVLTGIFKLGLIVKKETVSQWYLEVTPLEWRATNVTSTADFKSYILPYIQRFSSEGNKYSLSLVKIMTRIIENTIDPDLKKLAFEELVKLLKLNVDFKSEMQNLSNLPKDMYAKLLKHPDRYAETRSFAAWSLINLASKSDNKQFCPLIKLAIDEWNNKVTASSQTPLKEKDEAQKRADSLNTQKAPLDLRVLEIQNQLKSVVGTAPSKAGGTSEEELKQEFLRINPDRKKLEAQIAVCNQEVALVNAYEEVVANEASLRDQFLPSLVLLE